MKILLSIYINIHGCVISISRKIIERERERDREYRVISLCIAPNLWHEWLPHYLSIFLNHSRTLVTFTRLISHVFRVGVGTNGKYDLSILLKEMNKESNNEFILNKVIKKNALINISNKIALRIFRKLMQCLCSC